MDAVFDAQFQNLRDSFLRRNIEVRVAYTPGGEVDYLYEEGRLLTLATGRERDVMEPLNQALPGIRSTSPAERSGGGVARAADAGDAGLEVLSLDALDDGPLTVPEALDLADRRLGDRNPFRATGLGGGPGGGVAGGGGSTLTPVHVLHISRICPAGEPEVPPGSADRPWPAPRPPAPPSETGAARHVVRVGVCDTGLLEKLDQERFPWLDGVDGDLDPLGPELAGGLRVIPQYTGHGTFVAGVLRCVAPTARVTVTDHFSTSGGELEHVVIRKLDELIRTTSPDIVNLSAGTYSRQDWHPLGFTALHRRWPQVTLVAAAGNDATDRPFYPAALPWVVGVGALGPDEQHRAWFSNYGDWVDVYALGEGMVNAYATGEYTYQEPPKRPAKQVFDGMARWDGTSFAAPLVAGLVAERMAATGAPAHEAAAEVLRGARTVEGTGRVLRSGPGESVTVVGDQ